MTEKLYYIDAYMRRFEGTVTECIEDKKRWKIVLDRTAFYPEGGGQPYDKGVLLFGEGEEEKRVEVFEVHEKDDVIYHYTREPIEPGTCVRGEIDWDRRFYMMQHHTADHIFSGVMLSEFGLNNIGFHLTDHDLVIDYDGALDAEQIRLVMDKANEFVWADQPVRASWPENVAEMEYRSKMAELKENIRIVWAGDRDVCACCGTHTSTTGQAGPIVVISFSHITDGTRVNLVCGKEAVDYLKRVNDDCLTISRSLSVPIDKVTEAFEKKMGEMESLRAQLSSFRKRMIDIWVDSAPVKDGVRAIIREGLDSTDVQKACVALSEKADIATVISGGEGAVKIAIVSSKIDTNKLGRAISAVIGGKGGGRPGIYQGFVERVPTEDELRDIIGGYLASL